MLCATSSVKLSSSVRSMDASPDCCLLYQPYSVLNSCMVCYQLHSSSLLCLRSVPFFAWCRLARSILSSAFYSSALTLWVKGVNSSCWNSAAEVVESSHFFKKTESVRIFLLQSSFSWRFRSVKCVLWCGNSSLSPEPAVVPTAVYKRKLEFSNYTRTTEGGLA